MIKNFDELVTLKHIPNWTYIFYYPYRILITAGSGSSKTNVLLNLIKHQCPDIDQTFFFLKVLFKSKYKLFIKRTEKVGNKQAKNPQAFIDYP